MTKKKDLQSLFQEYISYCKHSRKLRSETIRGYRSTFRSFSKIMPEVKYPHSLTEETMSMFFKRLDTRVRIVGRDTEKSGVKASTSRTYYSKLNSFFEWLRINKCVKKNPLQDMKAPEVIYDDHKTLDDSDVSKLLTVAKLRSKTPLIRKRDTAMIITLLSAGLRKGELIGLRVTDVDFESGLLQVRGETSKSKRTRRIPMHPALEEALEEYIAERNKRPYKSECLFVSNNEDVGLTRHGLKHWVNRYCELSGVRFHLHQFRHTFTCNLGRQNTSAIIIQKALGHTDLRMTQRYLRSMTPEDLHDDITRLNLAGVS